MQKTLTENQLALIESLLAWIKLIFLVHGAACYDPPLHATCGDEFGNRVVGGSTVNKVLSAAECHKQRGKHVRQRVCSIGIACMQQDMPFSM
jgi:hypothetical protein